MNASDNSAAPNSFAYWRDLAARSPAEAARTLMGRFAALSPGDQRAIWATIPTQEEVAEEFARGAASGGPLAGVPFAVKDLFAVAALPTGAGSTFLGAMRGPDREDAPVVAHLRRAGAVFAGKTHLHEFAYGLTGENPHFGDGPNLRFAGRVSGGSSSGSAAAVAGGIVPLALGTDTGGSVRVPAAFNGLWAFRARPHDRWVEQCFPLSPAFDTAGWFTTSASDLRETMAALFGAPVAASTPTAGAWLPARELAPDIETEVASALDAAAAAMASPLPERELIALRRVLDGALPAYVVIQSFEAAAVHARWLDERRGEYDPLVWSRIDRGRRWSTAEVAGARRKQADVRDAVHTILVQHGALVLPASHRAALRKVECTEENRTQLLRLTHIASLAGAPVMTIPIRLPDGLSGGLQMILPDYFPTQVDSLLAAR